MREVLSNRFSPRICAARSCAKLSMFKRVHLEGSAAASRMAFLLHFSMRQGFLLLAKAFKRSRVILGPRPPATPLQQKRLEKGLTRNLHRRRPSPRAFRGEGWPEAGVMRRDVNTQPSLRPVPAPY